MNDEELPPIENFDDAEGGEFHEEFDAPAKPAAKAKKGFFAAYADRKKKAKAAAEKPAADDTTLPVMTAEEGSFDEVTTEFSEGGEDEEFVEEDWEEFDEMGAEGELPADDPIAIAKATKKKNSNRIIIGGALAAGLVVAFLNMSGGPKSGPAAVARPTQVANTGGTRNTNENMSTRDIIYGRANDPAAIAARQQQAEEDAGNVASRAKSGVLNDPLLMKDIESKTRSAEFDDSYYYDQEGAGKSDGKGFGGNAPHEVNGAAQPPLPKEAAAQGATPPGTTAAAKPEGALTPMPENASPATGGPVIAVAPVVAPENEIAAVSPSAPANAEDPVAAHARAAAGVADAMNPADSKLPTADKFAKADTKAAPAAGKPAVKEAEENPFATTAPVSVANEPVQSEELPAPVTTTAEQESPLDLPANPSPVQQAASTATSSTDAKLDALMNRLSQIETQITSVTARQDAQIEKLQKTVSTFQQGGTVAKTVSSPAAQDLTEEVPQPVAIAPRVRTPEAAPAIREKPAIKTRSASAAPAAKASGAKGYVLKSAQPGRAMVAKNGETYTVAVGESLPGIGRIIQIYDRGGQWVVRGTSGTVSQ